MRGLHIIFLFALLQYSCLARESGPGKPFNKTVQTEVKLGLHIVPVQLNGKTYRFLFDTGAPTSISKEVQEALQYKVVDRGHIVDSDKNRIKVAYVRVDSVVIEDVRFSNVRAFVADFTANPTLACLELDGILGSNMMQACNWQIDYVNEQIRFSNEPFLTDASGSFEVAFRADSQYDIIVDMKMGRAKVSNMKIDYGNNSSITIPHKVFNVLFDEGILEDKFLESGFNQGGIGAKPISMTRYYGYLDSLQIGDLVSTNLTLKTGKSGLVGRDFLSRYVVAINWSEKKLRFKPHKSWEDSRLTFGYSIGLNSTDQPVLFGVTEGSDAADKMLTEGMRILKVDTLDFSLAHDYCDFIDFIDSNVSSLDMVLQDSNGTTHEVTLTKTLLNRK